MKSNTIPTIQLAKIKKLIAVNNPESFALAVALLSTLEAGEDQWLEIISKKRCEILLELRNDTVTTLFLEASIARPRLRERVWCAGSTAIQFLTTLSDAAAELLSKHKGDLWLSGLTTLSDAAAESLSKLKGDLHLGGMTTLSDAAAESLSKLKSLDLQGLTQLSGAAVESLAKVPWVYLSGSVNARVRKVKFGASRF